MKQRRRKWQISGGTDPSVPAPAPATTEPASGSSMMEELKKKVCIQDGQAEQYEVVRTLGRGAQGRVTLVSDRDGVLAARKEIECREHAAEVQTRLRRLVAEIEILNDISNENIVSSSLVYFDKKNSELHIVMEYMDCGSLMDVLRHLTDHPIPSPVTAVIAKQILSGISALHYSENGKHYMHRDIKPENILLCWDGRCKLADFGVAKSITNTCNATMQSQIGNYAFMAPERLMPGSKYGSASDIWAVGMLTLNMLLGKYPFQIKAFFDIIRLITKFDLSLYSGDISDSDAVQFLDSLLQVEPSDRVPAKTALDSPYITKSGSIALVATFLQENCPGMRSA